MQRSHLLKVQRDYPFLTKRESSKFRSWYKVPIPELNMEKVERLIAPRSHQSKNFSEKYGIS